MGIIEKVRGRIIRVIFLFFSVNTLRVNQQTLITAFKR